MLNNKDVDWRILAVNDIWKGESLNVHEKQPIMASNHEEGEIISDEEIPKNSRTFPSADCNFQSGSKKAISMLIAHLVFRTNVPSASLVPMGISIIDVCVKNLHQRHVYRQKKSHQDHSRHCCRRLRLFRYWQQLTVRSHWVRPSPYQRRKSQHIMPTITKKSIWKSRLPVSV